MPEGTRKNSVKVVIVILAVIAAVLSISFAVVPRLVSGAQMPPLEPCDLSFLPELELPDSKIIAVGTPTHGNAEPTELALGILKKVYEEYGSVAFILEEIAGEAETINKQHSYTREDGSKTGMYLVYDNGETADILNWLYETNQRFYGIDVQSIAETAKILSDSLDGMNFPAAAKVLTLPVSSKQLIEQNSPFLDTIEEYVEGQTNAGIISEQESAYLLHLVDCVRMNYEYIMSDYSFEVRDKHMARNVEWIMDYEKSYYNNERAVLLASNGHVIKSNWSYGFSGDVYNPIGAFLSARYNDDYFVILTDAKENYFEAGTSARNAAHKKIFHIYNDYPDVTFTDRNTISIVRDDCSTDENQSRELVVIGSIFTNFRLLRDTYYKAQISPKDSCDILLYYELMTPPQKTE